MSDITASAYGIMGATGARSATLAGAWASARGVLTAAFTADYTCGVEVADMLSGADHCVLLVRGLAAFTIPAGVSGQVWTLKLPVTNGAGSLTLYAHTVVYSSASLTDANNWRIAGYSAPIGAVALDASAAGTTVSLPIVTADYIEARAGAEVVIVFSAGRDYENDIAGLPETRFDLGVMFAAPTLTYSGATPPGNKRFCLHDGSNYIEFDGRALALPAEQRAASARTPARQWREVSYTKGFWRIETRQPWATGLAINALTGRQLTFWPDAIAAPGVSYQVTIRNSGRPLNRHAGRAWHSHLSGIIEIGEV